MFTKAAVGLPYAGWFRAESATRWIVHNCALHLAYTEARACVSGTDAVKISCLARTRKPAYVARHEAWRVETFEVSRRKRQAGLWFVVWRRPKASGGWRGQGRS